MPTDTITSIENTFFDGLKAIQDPTIEAARKAAELVGQVPFADRAAELAAPLPTAEAILSRNFAFAQRLLETQRDFVLQLAAVGPTPDAKPTSSKKSAA